MVFYATWVHAHLSVAMFEPVLTLNSVIILREWIDKQFFSNRNTMQKSYVILTMLAEN